MRGNAWHPRMRTGFSFNISSALDYVGSQNSYPYDISRLVNAATTAAPAATAGTTAPPPPATGNSTSNSNSTPRQLLEEFTPTLENYGLIERKNSAEQHDTVVESIIEGGNDRRLDQRSWLSSYAQFSILVPMESTGWDSYYEVVQSKWTAATSYSGTFGSSLREAVKGRKFKKKFRRYR